MGFYFSETLCTISFFQNEHNERFSRFLIHFEKSICKLIKYNAVRFHSYFVFTRSLAVVGNVLITMKCPIKQSAKKTTIIPNIFEKKEHI